MKISRALTHPLLALAFWATAAIAREGGSATRADQLRAALADHSRPQIFIAVHRGDWRGYSENSVPGIRSCIAMGVEIVEIDVRQTRDGHFVLMHDSKVDRTTNGTGAVKDLTLEEIKKLRLRNGMGRVTNWTVPTLEEALLAARGKILLNLDKCYGSFPAIYSLLEKTGTTGQVIIKPEGNTPVATVRELSGAYHDRLLFMPLINIDKANGLDLGREYLKTMKPFAMEIVYRKWRPEYAEFFAECARQGTRIWINVMWPGLAGELSDDQALEDPAKVYGWLVEQGATILQTDRPLLLRQYVAERRLLPATAQP